MSGLSLSSGPSGVSEGGVWYPTESGLSAQGGFFDRLQAAMDSQAQYQGKLRGIAPLAQAMGVPVQAPAPGLLSQLFSSLGIGGGQQPQSQPMPTATATSGGGASMPTGPAGVSTQAQPAGAAPAAPPMAGGFMPMFGNAIASIESGGKYDATGPATANGDQALGKYQVMASNVGPWTKELLGQALTPEQFLASPQAQDAVFQGKFGQYLQKTGNPQDAASMWFTGRPLAQGAGAQDQLGQTGSGYVQKFIAALRGGGAVAQGDGGVPAQATAYAPAGSDDGTMMPQATASRAQPTQAVALANSNIPGAPGGGGAASAQGGTSASPSQVIAPLMANAATRPLGGALWKDALQQNGGALPNTMSLPAGLTPQALAAMITEPTTQQAGIDLLQKAMFPQVQAFKPGDYLVRGTQPMGQVPSPLQHVEIGRDDYGQPTYGAFNPQSGISTPDARQGGSGSGFAATGTADASLPSGPDFLKTLPPGLQAQVKAIAEGRMKLPAGTSANSPIAQRLRQFTLQYDPGFDATNADARFETRKDFASGKTAQSINSGNTAIQHAADLSDAAEALGNGNVPLFNKFKQAVGDQTGGNIPGKEFAGALNDFADEVVRFYRNSGGTESDIAAVRAALDPSQSPDQLRAGIQQQARLIAGKTNAVQNEWHQGMGPLAGDYPILSQDTLAALDRINARRPSVSSYPPKDAGGGPGAASAGLPVAAPAQGGPGQGGASAPSTAGSAATKTIRGVTYTRGPDGHWYMGQ